VRDRRRDIWIGTTEATALLGDRGALDQLIEDGCLPISCIGIMTYVRVRDLHPFLPQSPTAG
jgi:hypothetical protein